MRLVQIDGGWVLEDIKQDRNPDLSDIHVKNLSGRQFNQNFQPENIIRVWIDDPDIRKVLTEDLHLYAKPYEFEVKDENGATIGTRTRYSVKFKAVPKIEVKEIGGSQREVISPIVMLKTDKTNQLDISNFRLIDSCRLSKLVIQFHVFPNKHDLSKPWINRIDEVWAECADSDGLAPSTYIRDNWDFDPDDEEVPFN